MLEESSGEVIFIDLALRKKLQVTKKDEFAISMKPHKGKYWVSSRNISVEQLLEEMESSTSISSD